MLTVTTGTWNFGGVVAMITFLRNVPTKEWDVRYKKIRIKFT